LWESFVWLHPSTSMTGGPRMREDTTLDVAAAYSQYRRRLFGALAVLARQGFAVQLADGLDLIQEFFTEAWDGLKARYDPTRGPFDHYIFGAFVQFARPRILRLQRWQNCLVDAAKLADLVSQEPAEEFAEVAEPTTELVRHTLLTLAPRHRRLLYAYLSVGARGERKLAREFALTRYRVREVLTEALGQFIVRLGERGAISEPDWEVALALWRDGRTVRQGAGFLRRSANEIRESRSRIIALLAGSIRQLEQGYSSPSRSPIMPELRVHPRQLLKQVFLEPGNKQLLAEVRERADELISYLDKDDDSIDTEISALQTNPEWLVLVQEALAKEEPLSPAEQEIRAELFQARADDEKSVGRAFTEALLADVPAQLTDWPYWFGLAPRPSAEQREYLIQQVSVKAALPRSADLVFYGLTPVSIYYATEAVAFVAEEVLSRELRKPEPAVRIRVDESPLRDLPPKVTAPIMEPNDWPRWENRRVIPSELLVEEIVHMADCPLSTAHALLPWLVALAQFKPFLFADLESSPIGKKAVELTLVSHDQAKIAEDQFDTDGTNLYQRWGRRS
jgi:hypothetical protein